MTGKPLEDLLPDTGPGNLARYAGPIAQASVRTNGPCCSGAAEHGPLGCTCWVPVFDQDQSTELELDVFPNVMPLGCRDCAYRADSPERQGAPEVSGDQEFLERIVVDGEPFWCHDGMRQIVAFTHPTGARIELPRDVAYDPPIANGTPYRTDGRPGSLCAGWSARRLKHVLAQEEN